MVPLLIPIVYHYVYSTVLRRLVAARVSRRNIAVRCSPVSMIRPPRFTVHVSDHVRSPMNLPSDVRRKLRDNSIELHNCIDRWNECASSGGVLLRAVADRRILLFDTAPSCDADRTLFEANSDAERLAFDLLPKLDAIVEKMAKLRDSFSSIATLYRTPECDYAGMTTMVVEEYGDEVRCKRMMLEAIAEARERADVMMCVAGWVHAPYVDEKRVRVAVDAMVACSKGA